MAHPYKAAGHKNDPKWVGGLNKYVVPAVNDDAKAVIRNYGGDAATTKKAAYSPPAKGTGK